MKKFLPIIIGMVLAGGAFFAYQQFFSGGGKSETPAQAQAKQLKKDQTDKKARIKDGIIGPVVPLATPFIVNLADTGLNWYANISVSLQVDPKTPFAKAGADATAPTPLEENDQIRDIIMGILTSKTSQDVATAAGKEEVKKEIVDAINRDTRYTVAEQVYFTDFAIQPTAG